MRSVRGQPRRREDAGPLPQHAVHRHAVTTGHIQRALGQHAITKGSRIKKDHPTPSQKPAFKNVHTSQAKRPFEDAGTLP
jgi:hypothetical protein